MGEQNDVKKETRKLRWSEAVKNLKWYEIAAALWPILLILSGGALGGACGGVACYFNIKVFNAKLPKPLKYLYVFLVGIGGILLYLLAVIALSIIFPNLFKR